MCVFVMIGKSYDVVSFAAQEPNATVFVSSPNESKVGMWLRLCFHFLCLRIHVKLNAFGLKKICFSYHPLAACLVVYVWYKSEACSGLGVGGYNFNWISFLLLFW